MEIKQTRSHVILRTKAVVEDHIKERGGPLKRKEAVGNIEQDGSRRVYAAFYLGAIDSPKKSGPPVNRTGQDSTRGKPRGASHTHDHRESSLIFAHPRPGISIEKNSGPTK